MELYGDRISSSTRRVLATADHVGASLDFMTIDIVEGRNRRDDFLRLNPSGTIPVLVDGSSILFEASAIMVYLAERFDSDLLPRDASRIHVLKWTLWAAEHFRQGPNILLEERYLKGLHGEPGDPHAIAWGEALTRRHAAVLDEQFRQRRFIVGDAVTLADLDLAAPFSHLARSRAPLSDYPHLVSWHARLCAAVPAWRQRGEDLELRILELQEAGRAARDDHPHATGQR